MNFQPILNQIGIIFGPVTAQTMLWFFLGVIAGMLLTNGRGARQALGAVRRGIRLR